jgi:hypothetical protein
VAEESRARADQSEQRYRTAENELSSYKSQVERTEERWRKVTIELGEFKQRAELA